MGLEGAIWAGVNIYAYQKPSVGREVLAGTAVFGSIALGTVGGYFLGREAANGRLWAQIGVIATDVAIVGVAVYALVFTLTSLSSGWGRVGPG